MLGCPPASATPLSSVPVSAPFLAPRPPRNPPLALLPFSSRRRATFPSGSCFVLACGWRLWRGATFAFSLLLDIFCLPLNPALPSLRFCSLWCDLTLLARSAWSDPSRSLMQIFSTDNGAQGERWTSNQGGSGPNGDTSGAFTNAVGTQGPFRGCKASLYDGGHRVPFIVSRLHEPHAACWPSIDAHLADTT